MDARIEMQRDALRLGTAQEPLVQFVDIDVRGVGFEEGDVGGVRAKHWHACRHLRSVEQRERRREATYRLEFIAYALCLLHIADDKGAATLQDRVRGEAGGRSLQERARGAAQCAHLRRAIALAEMRRRTAGGVEARERFALQHHDARMRCEKPGDRSTSDAGADHDHVDVVRVHALSLADCAATTLVAARSAVTLPSVARVSGSVSTASMMPRGPTGRPIACATGTFVAMKVTWPGRPTEPRLMTTANAAPAASWPTPRSMPNAQAMKLAETMYWTGLVSRNRETAIGSTSEVIAVG